MWSVVDRNVVVRRKPVLETDTFSGLTQEAVRSINTECVRECMREWALQ